MPIVYMATNIINGKRYIGVTKHSLAFRQSQHIYVAKRNKGGGMVISSAIRKYGEESFKWEIIAEKETYDSVLSEEIRLIAELEPEYNVTRGGQGASFPRSQETKDKTSKALMGHIVTAETRAKLTGRKHSSNTIEKLKQIGREKSRIMEFRHLGPEALSIPVLCLTDGKIYPSASSAATDNSISKSMVIELCRLNPRRKTAGGKVFRYFHDFEVL